MGNYKIIHSETNQVMVMTLSYDNPFNDQKEMEKDLKHAGIKGEVIFDLLLMVGISFNRYISVNFNGENLDVKNAAIINAPIPNDIDEASIKFYVENNHLLEQSVLTEEIKEQVKNGKLSANEGSCEFT